MAFKDEDIQSAYEEEVGQWNIPTPEPPPPSPPGGHIDTSGFDVLIARLQLLPAVAKGNSLNNLLEVAERVMEDSRENYCPFESGDLKLSGVVGPGEDAASVILMYGEVGSGAEDYALEQHENMSYDHSAPKHSGIGGPKYLERPMLIHHQEFVEAVEQGLKSTVEMTSTGWASGDWKQIKRVYKGYSRGGSIVAPHYQRVKK